MDKRDWYYGQTVSESELDQAFGWVEHGIDYVSEDNRLYGVHTGFTVVQNPSGADLRVSVSSGLATNKEGSRMYEASSQLVDCEYDEYGTLTRVTPASGNEKYIAVFIRPNDRLEAPEADGAGITVYSEIYEDSEMFVRQGTEAAAGFAVKVAALSTAIKLCDILLTDGMTQILNADIDTDDREDWFRGLNGVAYTTIADQVHGTPYAAIDSLFTLVDGLSVAGGVGFTAAGTWDDGSAIVATDVEAAINEIVSDLADDAGSDRVGSAAHVTTHGNCDLSAGSVWDALVDIADVVDTAIDSQIIGAASDETISGAWTFDNSPSIRPIDESENVIFDDAPRFRTLLGGSMPPGSTEDHWMTKDYSSGYLCHGAGDSVNNYGFTAGTDSLVDICAFVETSGSLSDDPRHLALLTDGGYVKVKPVRVVGGSEGSFQVNTTGFLPAPIGAWKPQAFCFDVAARPYCYIMFWDTGDNSHRVQAYNTADFSRKAGWPAQGVALPSAGASVAQSDRIIVSIQSSEADSRITTVNSWVTRTAAADPCLTTLKCTDGTIICSGAGDLDVNQVPTGGIATNGTQVYYSSKSGAAASRISSADINNLSVSTLGTFTPLAMPAGNNANVYDIICLPNANGSDDTIIFNRGDSDALGLDNTALIVHGADYAGNYRSAYLDITGGVYAGCEDGSLTWDGRNIWLQMTDPSALSPFLFKVPFSSLAHNATTVIADHIGKPYFLVPRSDGTASPLANVLGRCCFDGESVWTILDYRASQTLSGIIIRVPSPERY